MSSTTTAINPLNKISYNEKTLEIKYEREYDIQSFINYVTNKESILISMFKLEFEIKEGVCSIKILDEFNKNHSSQFSQIMSNMVKNFNLFIDKREKDIRELLSSNDLISKH